MSKGKLNFFKAEYVSRKKKQQTSQFYKGLHQQENQLPTEAIFIIGSITVILIMCFVLMIS